MIMITPFLFDDGYKEKSNYLGYIFSNQARKMLKEIKEAASKDGSFKLERALIGNETLPILFSGNIKDIKGSMLNRMYSEITSGLTEIDLATAYKHYKIVDYDKKQQRKPNRFLEQIRRADEKWALKNTLQNKQN